MITMKTKRKKGATQKIIIAIGSLGILTVIVVGSLLLQNENFIKNQKQQLRVKYPHWKNDEAYQDVQPTLTPSPTKKLTPTPKINGVTIRPTTSPYNQSIITPSPTTIVTPQSTITIIPTVVIQNTQDAQQMEITPKSKKTLKTR